jgi:hypothetical protein
MANKYMKKNLTPIGKANENYTEIPSHPSQTAIIKKTTNAGKD